MTEQNWVQSLLDLVRKHVLPDLHILKNDADRLSKDLESVASDNSDLRDKYDKLNERLSRIEGVIGGLEKSLEAKIEVAAVKIRASLPDKKE